MKRAICYLAFLSLMVISCGEDTAPTALADGWAFFSSGQSNDAHASFVAAVESGQNEGYVGLGWVCIDLDSMPSADNYFQLASADSNTDGYAGWSSVLWARGNYAGSIAKADFVLRNDPSYIFEFRPAVNFQDMHWYQASSYLHLGNYSLCLSKIQELDADFTTDLNAANVGDVLAVKLELLAGQLRKQKAQ